LNDVERLASDFLKEAEAQKLRVNGAGIGVCELVDRSGNIVSANCFDWRDTAVRDRLSNLGPIVIEADVRAAALGEAHFGAGKPFKQFLYVTIGTGISCCLVLEGKPFTGSRGLTGTMASSPLPRGNGAGAGPMPTLEEVASGPALVKRFREAGGSASSASQVVAAANRADQIAIEVVRSGAEALGASLGWLINVLDPEAVVLGGGLGLSQGLYRETMIAATRRHTWSELHHDVQILSAALGADAGIVGAAAALWLR
jgi:glucokinase